MLILGTARKEKERKKMLPFDPAAMALDRNNVCSCSVMLQCSQHLAFQLTAVYAAAALNSTFSKYKECLVSCSTDYINLGSIYMWVYIDLLYL